MLINLNIYSPGVFKEGNLINCHLKKCYCLYSIHNIRINNIQINSFDDYLTFDSIIKHSIKNKKDFQALIFFSTERFSNSLNIWIQLHYLRYKSLKLSIQLLKCLNRNIQKFVIIIIIIIKLNNSILHYKGRNRAIAWVWSLLCPSETRAAITRNAFAVFCFE